MGRHRLTLTIDFDAKQEVPDFHCKGSFDTAISAFEAQMKRVLNASLTSTSLMTVDVAKVEGLTEAQRFHGERIAAKGRHNGTAEA